VTLIGQRTIENEPKTTEFKAKVPLDHQKIMRFDDSPFINGDFASPYKKMQKKQKRKKRTMIKGQFC
jgi:hypothetical protein